MPDEPMEIFTQDEFEAIEDKISTLEDMRFLGGEEPAIDSDGAPIVLVMPLEDGPPRYVIRKRNGQFSLLTGDATTTLVTGKLDDILAALP